MHRGRAGPPMRWPARGPNGWPMAETGFWRSPPPVLPTCRCSMPRFAPATTPPRSRRSTGISPWPVSATPSTRSSGRQWSSRQGESSRQQPCSPLRWTPCGRQRWSSRRGVPRSCAPSPPRRTSSCIGETSSKLDGWSLWPPTWVPDSTRRPVGVGISLPTWSAAGCSATSTPPWVAPSRRCASCGRRLPKPAGDRGTPTPRPRSRVARRRP